MKLNNAEFVDLKINNTDVSLDKMVEYLLNAKDLVADIYLNNRLALTGTARMTTDNNYAIASIDGRFALSESVNISGIIVQVRQANEPTNGNIILSSTTPAPITVDSGDTDVDLYFKVINLTPNCTTKCSVPDSKFNHNLNNKITPIVLSSQPSLVS